MSTERVIFLTFFLSVHVAVIQSETEENSNVNIQNSDPNILDDGWDDMNPILNSPFNLIFSDLDNFIKDDFRRMEKNMPNDPRQDSYDFHNLALPNRMKMNLPISIHNNYMPTKIAKYKSETRNDETASSAIQNEVLNINSLFERYFNSLGRPENEEQHLEKLNNSFGSFLENENVDKDPEKSIGPIDLFGPGGLRNQPIFNTTSDEYPKKKIGEIHFIDLGRNHDETVPMEKIIENSMSLPHITMPKKAPISENDLFPSVHRIMDDFADSMKNMMNILRNTLSNISMNNELLEKKTKTPDLISKLNISVHYHGETYFIPSNAHVSSDNSGIVNITWKSEMTNINNSLCIKLSTDGSGNIILKQVHLRLMKDNEMHEYKLDTRVYLKTSNSTTNGTTIQLAERVGVKFSGFEILELVTIDMTENYSNHWLAFSIAILGLIVAGLIMLLSYIIFKKNQTYARKGSLSKEAIVY